MKKKYLDQVKEFEGFHSKPYWDYRQWTNGYGTRAKHKNEYITREEAEKRLLQEMAHAASLVSNFAKKHNLDMPEGVHAALTSLTYNAGAKWMRLGLGKRIAAGQYTLAKKNFVQYNKAGGKTLRGLVKRRHAEVKWFDDEDQNPIKKPAEDLFEAPKESPTPSVFNFQTTPSQPVEPSDYAPWLTTAKAFVGRANEIAGARDNPVVVALWHLGRAGNVHDDETPWCAAFVSAVLELDGIRSARTGWSRSYLEWGKKLDKPIVGCIVVFSRGSGGHVGFVVGQTPSGDLLVLGGNQSNAVNVKSFPRNRVLGYRWPDGSPINKQALPVFSDPGRSLREI